MRRRHSYRPGSYGTEHTTTVDIYVPARLAHLVANELYVPSVRQRQLRSRTLSVPLKNSGKTKRVKVKLRYKPQTNVIPQKVAVDRKGRIRQYSYKNTIRSLQTEYNRRRHDKKSHRKRASDIHLGSVRDDRFGIIGANRHRGILAINDAAMVHNALTSRMV